MRTTGPLLVLLAACAPERPGVHAEHAAAPPSVGPPTATPAVLPPPQPPLDHIVYGYAPSWNSDPAAIPWDHLTHVALFSANVGADGRLSGKEAWGDVAAHVALAEPYGVRVHLCVTQFTPSTLDELLRTASSRDRLIDELVTALDETGAHGVNLDLEGVPAARRADLVTLVDALTARVDEVFLASPAVDWSDAWDSAALTRNATLFIMGYDYHWTSSSEAGPVDPLYGGDPWSPWALDWTIDDYLGEGAAPERLVLGLPLYGRRWATGSSSYPTAALATGTTVLYADAPAGLATHGARWDEHSHSGWYWDGSGQAWVPTLEGVSERIAYGLDAGLGGVGFWALHYDGEDPQLWDAVETLVGRTAPIEEPTGDWVAAAGPPVLAAPGDTVTLDGTGSTTPSGATAHWRWSQPAGEPISLTEPDSATPSFVVPGPGTLAFDLEVGDGTAWSPPARTWVVVPDPALGRTHTGCDGTGGTPVPLFFLLLPLLRTGPSRPYRRMMPTAQPR